MVHTFIAQRKISRFLDLPWPCTLIFPMFWLAKHSRTFVWFYWSDWFAWRLEPYLWLGCTWLLITWPIFVGQSLSHSRNFVERLLLIGSLGGIHLSRHLLQSYPPLHYLLIPTYSVIKDYGAFRTVLGLTNLEVQHESWENEKASKVCEFPDSFLLFLPDSRMPYLSTLVRVFIVPQLFGMTRRCHTAKHVCVCVLSKFFITNFLRKHKVNEIALFQIMCKKQYVKEISST